ncbi:hypothetical protein GHO40_16415 [Pseudomonas helleri]|uniref:Fibronectin type-III domain-containing protein n=2 Tax=Pseudomonas TaxID=286 RepID=A0A7X1WAQ5_9PSED|nr:hypothetical protein [Pseudomonas helleri]MQT48291.1 hypothetical protein [Pseudomonas helleri]
MKKTLNEIPDYNLSTWMTDLGIKLDKLKPHQLTLPSTHNAGMDKKGIGGPVEGWIACQNDTFPFQIAQGARVFDLRVNARVYNGTLSGFDFFHGPFSSNRSVLGLIKDCNAFFKNDYKSKKHELIILQFQEFKNFRPSDYERLLTQLTQGFSGTGSSTKIVPRAASDLTIGDIRSQYAGHNIIIASDKFGSNSDVWNDITHEWIGHDIPSEQELDIFIDQKTRETNQSKLWSLQVVRYKILYGAMDISDYIDKKFEPDAQALINSNIINVDFIENFSIVPYCIRASLYKAGQLIDKDPPSQPTVHDELWHRGWSTYFITFNASIDNFGVDHYLYSINDGEKIKVNSQNTPRQQLEFEVREGQEYELKLYAVDVAGNCSTPLVKALKGFDPPTGSDKPLPPDIVYSKRDGKYACSMLIKHSIYNADHYIFEIYAEKDIVEGKPVGEPILWNIASRWALGVMFTNLPSYDAYLITAHAVNSFGRTSDYAIKRIDAYRPSVTPPSPPSNLSTSYNSVTQQLTINFDGGGLNRTHTLTIKTDTEKTYESFYSGNAISVSLSLDFTLTLFAVNQDGNQSTSITYTGSTKETSSHAATPINGQTVLRQELTTGVTTWKGGHNIVKYKIHLYDTQDVQGGESGVDGKIIGQPLREEFYSGSDLTYTFNNLIPLKNYHVFVWGINAYGTVGERAYNSNYTYLHGDPAWDQEYPTVPSNLLGRYRYREGVLNVFWNASSDNRGISHYEVTINNQLYKVLDPPVLGAFQLTVSLAKDINYQVHVYAVDTSGNRSRTAAYYGDTSNKDTLSYSPTKESIGFTYAQLGIATFTWEFIHTSEIINLIIGEPGATTKQHVRVSGTATKASVPNLVPRKEYIIELYGTNSYGVAGESTTKQFFMPTT